MGGGKIVVLGPEDAWETHVKEGTTVVVDFTAGWCGPCQMIAPFFAQLSELYDDITFLKVDVDERQDISAKCGISCMPTFQVWVNGQKADEFSGASKPQLKALAEKYSSKKPVAA